MKKYFKTVDMICDCSYGGCSCQRETEEVFQEKAWEANHPKTAALLKDFKEGRKLSYEQAMKFRRVVGKIERSFKKVAKKSPLQ